jgi:hypothetical protein
MSYIDQGDVRYQVLITGGENGVPLSYDAYRQTAPTDASPDINAKPEVAPERIIRGKTVTYENITYALLLFLLPASILIQGALVLLGGFLGG